jgi:hypothetical protein
MGVLEDDAVANKRLALKEQDCRAVIDVWGCGIERAPATRAHLCLFAEGVLVRLEH